MTETAPAATFTAQEAAATLSHLEHYEETLTARAFGVTMIAFGIAGAATSMTYAYASDAIAAAGHSWLLSLLWFPWILSAGIATSVVWRTHAVTLRRDEDRGSWLWFVVFSFLYMGLLALAWWADSTLGLDLGEANQNVLTLGIFTLIIGAFFQSRFGWGWMIRLLYGVGVLLIAAAFVYGSLGLGPVAGQLLAAFTNLVLWVGAGTYAAMRG